MNEIINRLDKVKKRGESKWMACCPAHEDRDPSLAIQELKDGRILLKCFGGCATSDVLAAIGLSMSDLFPDKGLGEFKGWEKLQGEIKQRNYPSHDQTVLEIAKADRAAGKRLSRQDLERERQAYLRVKNANANG